MTVFDQPIRVANIIEEGRLGGPQIRIVACAAAMRGQVETSVIMPLDNSDAFRQLCEEVSVQYVRMPITRITKDWKMAFRYMLFSLVEIVRLAGFLRSKSFELVHVSGGSWQYKGVIAGRMAGIKVIWHLNDTSMPFFIRYLFRWLNHFSDGFIFASKRSADYYAPLLKHNKPEFIVPAPVDTKRFNPGNSHELQNELLSKWEDRVVVGTVANINPVKGIETLIRAAQLVNNSMDNVYFVVVGPVYENQKRYFKSLQDLCHELGVDNIEFIGGRKDVRALLKRFDIYLCTSWFESSPVSVWEAMAMALPIVSTDVGDVPEYVKNGKNGFIVKPGESVQLASQLCVLAQDSDMRNKLGYNSRQVAVRELDLENSVSRHLDSYHAIINEYSNEQGVA